MSNNDYELFTKAIIPNLRPLERALLGHYCQRLNDKASPRKAWPPRDELIRITGARDKSISRALGVLVEKGFLFRITLASKERGKRAEYGVNLELLKRYQVTAELPITDRDTPLEVTPEYHESNSEVLASNPEVLLRELTSYPKPNKPNKPINVERWQIITSYLPKDVKRLIKAGQNYESLLDELVRQGTSVTAIRDKLAKENYGNGVKVGSLFNYFLETYAGVKPVRENSLTPHCGDTNCDKETRQFDEPSLVNGELTFNCPKCHPLRKQLEPRTPDGISFSNLFRDVNES
jgi:hypothetical protein